MIEEFLTNGQEFFQELRLSCGELEIRWHDVCSTWGHTIRGNAKNAGM
jgi:hypothetical protein